MNKNIHQWSFYESNIWQMDTSPTLQWSSKPFRTCWQLRGWRLPDPGLRTTSSFRCAVWFFVRLRDKASCYHPTRYSCFRSTARPRDRRKPPISDHSTLTLPVPSLFKRRGRLATLKWINSLRRIVRPFLCFLGSEQMCGLFRIFSLMNPFFILFYIFLKRAQCMFQNLKSCSFATIGSSYKHNSKSNLKSFE